VKRSFIRDFVASGFCLAVLTLLVANVRKAEFEAMHELAALTALSLLCLFYILLSIAQRERAQAALRRLDRVSDVRIQERFTEREKATERYLNTLEKMLAGCQLIDFDWRYLYVNEAVVRHGRKTKAELLGRTMMECYPGIEDTEMFSALRRCMEERAVSYMESEFALPDGTVGWFELSVQPVPEGIFIVSIEITERKQLFKDLQRTHLDLQSAYDTTIEGWSRALDLRDKETEGHTQRVTELTVKLARRAGMSEAELLHVKRGALLHDIGKMGVPDHILLKPDKLTDDEWALMRKHPTYAYELLKPIEYLHDALDIPFCHHEKWDGTGYPRGLKGEDIPLAARLFAVVDVWDAIRSDRPYRQGWDEDRALEFIRSVSGTHLDPRAVELFMSLPREERPRVRAEVLAER
jgi:PAS domain S-box-containing protein/putative nucleotidyltransferase with HDIG domain